MHSYTITLHPEESLPVAYRGEVLKYVVMQKLLPVFTDMITIARVFTSEIADGLSLWNNNTARLKFVSTIDIDLISLDHMLSDKFVASDGLEYALNSSFTKSIESVEDEKYHSGFISDVITTREQLGLTQKELAVHVNLQESVIRALEEGSLPYDPNVQAQLAKWLAGHYKQVVCCNERAKLQQCPSLPKPDERVIKRLKSQTQPPHPTLVKLNELLAVKSMYKKIFKTTKKELKAVRRYLRPCKQTIINMNLRECHRILRHLDNAYCALSCIRDNFRRDSYKQVLCGLHSERYRIVERLHIHLAEKRTAEKRAADQLCPSQAREITDKLREYNEVKARYNEIKDKCLRARIDFEEASQASKKKTL